MYLSEKSFVLFAFEKSKGFCLCKVLCLSAWKLDSF
jgi:hypothetical protein